MAGEWSSGWKRGTRRKRSAKARTSAPSSTSRSLPRGWRRNWRRHAHSMRRSFMGSMARAELVGRVWAKSVGRELWGGSPVRGRRPRRPARMDGTYVALARSGSGGNPRGPGVRPTGLGAHDAGGGAQSAVPAVAVGAVAHRTIGARHLARVEGEQGALVVFNRTCVLADVAGVVNSAGQFAEIALFNGFEGAYADLGGFGDLLERDTTIAANRGQTKDAFLLFHLPASPSMNP